MATGVMILLGLGVFTAVVVIAAISVAVGHRRTSAFVADASDLGISLQAKQAERAAREALLDELARAIHDRQPGTAQLLFVCTHNSRRSQMAQVLATTLARERDVNVEAYSAGSEVTAMHPSAIAALERFGLSVVNRSRDADANPVVELRGPHDGPLMRCWSKRIDDASIPREDVIAVMVCAEADEACPSVPGAVVRIPLRFDDPRVADGTPDAADTYDKCCEQIARELREVYWRVARAM